MSQMLDTGQHSAAPSGERAKRRRPTAPQPLVHHPDAQEARATPFAQVEAHDGRAGG